MQVCFRSSFLIAAAALVLSACGATNPPPAGTGGATGTSGSTGTTASATSSGGTTGATTGASTTGSSTSGTSGLAACQACTQNSDCASNSCFRGHCDATGPGGTCSTDADCNGGTCHQYSSGMFCQCPSGGTTTGSASGGTTTGSSTTTGGTTGNSCTSFTWSNFGQSFFDNRCNGCHSFDHATVQSDTSYIQSKIDSGSMPRGSTLSSTEKANIDQYLSCGAP